MENTDPIKEKSRNARKPAKDSRKRGGQHEGAILRRAQRGAHGSFVGPAQARWPWRGHSSAVTGAHHREVRAGSGQSGSTGRLREKGGHAQWARGAESARGEARD